MNNNPLPLSEFGKILTEEIKKSPYNAYEVLNKIGVHKGYLSGWREQRKRAPTYIEVVELANILNIPVDCYMEGSLPRGSNGRL